MRGSRPDSALSPTRSTVIDARSPRPAGSRPASSLPARSRVATRPRESVSTPCQPASTPSPSQPSEPVHPSPPAAACSDVRAALSASLQNGPAPRSPIPSSQATNSGVPGAQRPALRPKRKPQQPADPQQTSRQRARERVPVEVKELQAPETAQLRRHRTIERVTAQGKSPQVCEASQLRRYRAVERVAAQAQRRQLREIPQLRRNRTFEHVAVEPQLLQADQTAQLRRNRALQGVGAQIERRQARQAPQFRRDRASQAVRHPLAGLAVPPAAEVQADDPVERVRLHPAPLPQRPVPQPVLVVGPVRPVRRRVQRGQHRPVPTLHRHRYRRRARDPADRRRDRGRPVAGRRHQPRRADRRHLGAPARPGHRRPGHHMPVAVAYACTQLQGRVRRRERRGRGRDRHADHAKGLGRRTRGAVTAPHRPRRGRTDRHPRDVNSCAVVRATVALPFHPRGMIRPRLHHGLAHRSADRPGPGCCRHCQIRLPYHGSAYGRHTCGLSHTQSQFPRSSRSEPPARRTGRGVAAAISQADGLESWLAAWNDSTSGALHQSCPCPGPPWCRRGVWSQPFTRLGHA